MCSVLFIGSKTEFTLYILLTELSISTGMKMSRYIQSTSKNKLFYRIPPNIKSPRPITIFPGAVLAVADHLLWVGLTCQSLRRFSRLTLLPRELSTNTIVL